jgi:hypothetical protein
MGPYVLKLTIKTKRPTVKFVNEDWEKRKNYPHGMVGNFLLQSVILAGSDFTQSAYSAIHGLARCKAPSYAYDDLRLSLLSSFLLGPYGAISEWKTVLGRRICF